MLVDTTEGDRGSGNFSTQLIPTLSDKNSLTVNLLIMGKVQCPKGPQTAVPVTRQEGDVDETTAASSAVNVSVLDNEALRAGAVQLAELAAGSPPSRFIVREGSFVRMPKTDWDKMHFHHS